MLMCLKTQGGRKMVLVSEGKTQLTIQNSAIDITLIKALIRAQLWQRHLNSAKYQTIQDLCDAKKSQSNICS